MPPLRDYTDAEIAADGAKRLGQLCRYEAHHGTNRLPISNWAAHVACRIEALQHRCTTLEAQRIEDIYDLCAIAELLADIPLDAISLAIARRIQSIRERLGRSGVQAPPAAGNPGGRLPT